MFPVIFSTISFSDSPIVLLLWIWSVFPVVSNYTLLPTCSSNFLSLMLKSLKYLWKVSAFCFFCILNLTYCFLQQITNLPSALLDLTSSITHWGPLKIWQVISFTVFRITCPFPSIIVALICTLSCCAMKAWLKASSLNGKPCLKICLYS